MKQQYTPIQACGNRAPVFIEGIRSAFVKSNGIFEDMDTLELFSRVTTGLLKRVPIDANNIGQIIAGTVIPQTKNPNVARDTVINLGLPVHIHGYSLNRACASSLESVFSAATTIMAGDPQFILAGGVECISDLPVVNSREARKFFVKLTKAKSAPAKLNIIKNFRAKAWFPKQPEMIEPLTGLRLGDHAELMAQKNLISRRDQDQYAFNSHVKTLKALDRGFFSQEIEPIWPPPNYHTYVDKDNSVIKNPKIDYFNQQKPVFEKKFGTVTVSNSSSLTDGAAICLIGDEQRSRDLQLNPKLKILDFDTVAIEPTEQLLLGPAISITRLLLKNKLTLNDIDRFEIHEAFAAQILSCLRAIDDKDFCSKYFNLTKPLGFIPPEKLNVNGGSLAIGHPFGATGARLLTTIANELIVSDLNLGIVAICASGAMASSILVERIR